MPLVLSLKEGDDLYVRDQQFVLSHIYDGTSFTLEKVQKDGTRVPFEITEKESVEVFDDVFVSAGDLLQNGIVRVVLDAPRSVLILRGDKYRGSAHENGWT